ncbi:MAG: isopentenyl-diphosphate Delta-isomerase [Gammaproteobacteria bacterium]|nr:isopentenyl-diphosphate delta-isomerase [Chromatiales bacterium]MDP6674091.1 isopentenyl-diphosphate Delta-isomerase [Gammaproteobacteria bacterium]
MNALHQPVSSPTESIILVDDEDREIGIHPKAECHVGQGLLHRAFSVFLFNANGELLLQKRSAQKPLWPLYWSNSCCSHPRESESVEEAGRRRIHEELNLQSDLRFLYKFKYQASFGDLGSEHELCHVFAGFTTDEVIAHPDEIAEWRYIAPNDLTREIAADGDRFTPWLKMEWQRIRADFLGEILAGITR